MVLWSRHSDRTRERVWHVAAPSILGAVGFILSAYFTSPILGMVSLSIAALGIYAAAPVFWTLPTAFLSGASAAGGIALINSLGNFGGYAGPHLLGFVKDQTQSFAVALLTLAALMAFAGNVALSLGHNADLEECPRRPARIWTGGVSEPACPSESSRETAGKDDLQEQTVARGRSWTW